MTTVLRLAPHTTRPGQQVIEIWYNGSFIGQVTADEGPGIRFISKYASEVLNGPGGVTIIKCKDL